MLPAADFASVHVRKQTLPTFCRGLCLGISSVAAEFQFACCLRHPSETMVCPAHLEPKALPST